ncbi:MAG: YrzE family protein [Oscillatoria sp. PMC 1051.18]|nr:YrzE family protein [Oscillatoria sp. PMC 1050.18]MEC5032014.1 YrzE family protein [Oscillatoria sp. PMC 1051.18]
MLESAGMLIEINKMFFWIAQFGEPVLDDPEDASLVFSGPQFWIAVIAGVVLAFAFQLLLTNLGVATGISLAGNSSDSHSHSHNSSESVGGTIRKISVALGLATLITVTIALFCATILAVKLSLLESAGLGAILGLVIWAAYFCILFWVSSTTVGSLVGSVVNTATSGFQALLGTATAAIGGKAASDRVVATAEAAASAVRREIGAAIDPESIRENLEDYLGGLRPPQLNLKGVKNDIEAILHDSDLEQLAGSDALSKVNRQTFVNLISDRSDLSKREVEQLANELESVWNRSVKRLPSKNRLEEFVDYVKSAAPDSLLGPEFNSKLDDLIEELRKRRKAQSTTPMQQAMTLSFNSLIGLVMGRSDISDMSVEKIIDRLQTAKDKFGEQTEQVKSQIQGKPVKSMAYKTIKADIDNYLLNTYSWQMTQPKIETEFREIIYDPEADPETVAEALTHFDRTYFANLLQQRGVFTQERIDEIANILETVRLEAIATANAAAERQIALSLMAEVEDYVINTPKAELSPAKIELDFKAMMSDADAEYEQLQSRLEQFDQPTFERMLRQREDLNSSEAEKINLWLLEARNRVLSDAKGTSEPVHLKAQIEQFLLDTDYSKMNRQTLEQQFRNLIFDPDADQGRLADALMQIRHDYFVRLLQKRGVFTQEQINQLADILEAIRAEVARQAQQAKYERAATAVREELEKYLLTSDREELTPEKIQLDSRAIFADSEADYHELNARLAQFDRYTFEKILNRRSDLSAEDKTEIASELEKARTRILDESRELTEAAKAKAEAQWLKVASYLRDTGKEELNPQGIKRDLQTLLDDPQTGVAALRTRTARFDRDTLVKLLSQRQEFSEEQVNQIIDQVEDNWHGVTHAPQKAAGKVKEEYDHVTSAIADYLRSTGKEELNPQGIKRDLQVLFSDPKMGARAMRQRLSQMDRDTLVQLLAQRQDLSEAQVNQIIDEVQANIRNFVKAPRRIASRAKGQVLDFEASLEDYLRSTDKEELNPEGIKRDLQQLVNDPRVGMSRIGSRLSQFDRSTITALLAQREDISEQEAAEISDRIFSVRDQIMAQWQQVQGAVQQVIDSILGRIRSYLNSLDRPELNYEGIKTDVQTMFDDPEAGFEAMRDRLSQFNRDTLVAILSSREDISEADVNRIIDQIEHTRNRLLQRAERLQLQAQRRLEEVKLEAQRQAEATRKAAAAAAWWLFATALISGIASSLGGALAVVD